MERQNYILRVILVGFDIQSNNSQYRLIVKHANIAAFAIDIDQTTFRNTFEDVDFKNSIEQCGLSLEEYNQCEIKDNLHELVIRTSNNNSQMNDCLNDITKNICNKLKVNMINVLHENQIRMQLEQKIDDDNNKPHPILSQFIFDEIKRLMKSTLQKMYQQLTTKTMTDMSTIKTTERKELIDFNKGSYKLKDIFDLGNSKQIDYPILIHQSSPDFSTENAAGRFTGDDKIKIIDEYKRKNTERSSSEFSRENSQNALKLSDDDKVKRIEEYSKRNNISKDQTEDLLKKVELIKSASEHECLDMMVELTLLEKRTAELSKESTIEHPQTPKTKIKKEGLHPNQLSPNQSTTELETF